MIRIKIWHCFIILSFFSIITGSASLSISIAAEVANPDQRTFNVVIKNGLLNLEVKDADLKLVLNEIAEKSKIAIIIDPEINKKLSLKIDSVPIENALRQIVKENYTIFFEKNPKTNKTELIKIGLLSVSTIAGTHIKPDDSEAKTLSIIDRDVDDRIRYRAISNAWNNKATMNQLAGILNDSNESRPFRIAAARSLAKAKDIRVIEDVKEIIQRTEDENLSYGLAVVLGYLNHPKTVSLLANILKTNNDSVLRYKAIQSIIKIGDPGAIEDLKRSAQDDTSKYNRAKAIIAIRSIGNTDSIPFLNKVKKHETDDFVRAVCEQQIIKLKGK